MYIVEGNIGAGKSTFLKLIEQHVPHVTIALEPLHNWQSKVYGQSLLSQFYDDPKRWTYSMETFAMICRVRDHLKEQHDSNPNRIAERSIYSGHYVFAQNGYEHGFMNDLEWTMYNEWFKFLTTNRCHTPHGFIYLHVDPEVAFDRIKKRNRVAEKKISLNYLHQIDQHHEKFLLKKEGVHADLIDVPVLVLDCNEDFESNPERFAQHAQAVQDFLITAQTQKALELTKVISL